MIALDVIEDFLVGEGYKFLRLVCCEILSEVLLQKYYTIRMATPKVQSGKRPWMSSINLVRNISYSCSALVLVYVTISLILL